MFRSNVLLTWIVFVTTTITTTLIGFYTIEINLVIFKELEKHWSPNFPDTPTGFRNNIACHAILLPKLKMLAYGVFHNT